MNKLFTFLQLILAYEELLAVSKASFLLQLIRQASHMI